MGEICPIELQKIEIDILSHCLAVVLFSKVKLKAKSGIKGSVQLTDTQSNL